MNGATPCSEGTSWPSPSATSSRQHEPPHTPAVHNFTPIHIPAAPGLLSPMLPLTNPREGETYSCQNSRPTGIQIHGNDLFGAAATAGSATPKPFAEPLSTISPVRPCPLQDNHGLQQAAEQFQSAPLRQMEDLQDQQHAANQQHQGQHEHVHAASATFTFAKPAGPTVFPEKDGDAKLVTTATAPHHPADNLQGHADDALAAKAWKPRGSKIPLPQSSTQATPTLPPAESAQGDTRSHDIGAASGPQKKYKPAAEVRQTQKSLATKQANDKKMQASSATKTSNASSAALSRRLQAQQHQHQQHQHQQHQSGWSRESALHRSTREPITLGLQSHLQGLVGAKALSRSVGEPASFRTSKASSAVQTKRVATTQQQLQQEQEQKQQKEKRKEGSMQLKGDDASVTDQGVSQQQQPAPEADEKAAKHPNILLVAGQTAHGVEENCAPCQPVQQEEQSRASDPIKVSWFKKSMFVVVPLALALIIGRRLAGQFTSR